MRPVVLEIMQTWLLIGWIEHFPLGNNTQAHKVVARKSSSDNLVMSHESFPHTWQSSVVTGCLNSSVFQYSTEYIVTGYLWRTPPFCQLQADVVASVLFFCTLVILFNSSLWCMSCADWWGWKCNGAVKCLVQDGLKAIKNNYSVEISIRVQWVWMFPTDLWGAITESGPAKHGLMTLWRSGNGCRLTTTTESGLETF